MRVSLLGLMHELATEAMQFPSLAPCAADCLAEIERQRRTAHLAAKAPHVRRGRKPRDLPWPEIQRMRKRLSWQAITDRLNAGGVQISRSQLIRRFHRRFKDTIVRTVTRG